MFLHQGVTLPMVQAYLVTSAKSCSFHLRAVGRNAPTVEASLVTLAREKRGTGSTKCIKCKVET